MRQTHAKHEINFSRVGSCSCASRHERVSISRRPYGSDPTSSVQKSRWRSVALPNPVLARLFKFVSCSQNPSALRCSSTTAAGARSTKELFASFVFTVRNSLLRPSRFPYRDARAPPLCPLSDDRRYNLAQRVTAIGTPDSGFEVSDPSSTSSAFSKPCDRRRLLSAIQSTLTLAERTSLFCSKALRASARRLRPTCDRFINVATRLSLSCRSILSKRLFGGESKLNRSSPPKPNTDQSSSVMCGMNGWSKRNTAERHMIHHGQRRFFLRFSSPKMSVFAASTNQSQ